MSKLTQIELIQAVLDGRKVRKKYWESWVYIYKKGEHIVMSNGGIFDLNFSGEWELYNQDVTFFEALEAMNQGKMAMREDNILTSTCPICFGEKDCLVLYKTNSVYTITKKDLISKWQILEGEKNE